MKPEGVSFDTNRQEIMSYVENIQNLTKDMSNHLTQNPEKRYIVSMENIEMLLKRPVHVSMCPHLEPIIALYEDIAETAGEDLSILFEQFDETPNGGYAFQDVVFEHPEAFTAATAQLKTRANKVMIYDV